jgi:hypothetical protein
MITDSDPELPSAAAWIHSKIPHAMRLSTLGSSDAGKEIRLCRDLLGSTQEAHVITYEKYNFERRLPNLARRGQQPRFNSKNERKMLCTEV